MLEALLVATAPVGSTFDSEEIIMKFANKNDQVFLVLAIFSATRPMSQRRRSHTAPTPISVFLLCTEQYQICTQCARHTCFNRRKWFAEIDLCQNYCAILYASNVDRADAVGMMWISLLSWTVIDEGSQLTLSDYNVVE
ncbi:hypothetical protein HYPSUDRAFT_435822 [Hypholoma sublateritium FD-334 SS-4]|uniref:Uncharacterized protein n=1 Tax=Hypholoma sublateritium (strain FD-334 SS-4) TaxID=945553 RepID=A0A0D2LCQ7_HYPSF|nr:hypothetical protein HYPSUDRAFT_435822 [Hypholoma sublateritium FD-334 SS-4]